MILHEQTTSLICAADGYVGADVDHGLYFEDARFLTQFALELDSARPHLLNDVVRTSSEAIHVPDALHPGSEEHTEKEQP